MSIHRPIAGDNALAELAYSAVKNVPTIEPNDRNRLGYHVWLFLRGEIPTLKSAVEQARSRYQPRTLPIEDVITFITNELESLKSGSISVGAAGMVTKP